VAYSPVLYRMFCAATGYNGTVRRAEAVPPDAANGSAGDTSVTVAFDSNVSEGLPWEFRPEQRSVTVTLGQPTTVYYYAKNNSNATIVARAAFNVTPADVAPYFFKIQCFCFTDERLRPGESAEMPVVFYIDKQAAADPAMKGIDQVTLSYTFYPQSNLTPAQVAQARDLASGSTDERQQLAAQPPLEFANDAPRE
jgi:cytochrome c oxidase assembly protein subunit 11